MGKILNFKFKHHDHDSFIIIISFLQSLFINEHQQMLDFGFGN